MGRLQFTWLSNFISSADVKAPLPKSVSPQPKPKLHVSELLCPQTTVCTQVMPTKGRGGLHQAPWQLGLISQRLGEREGPVTLDRKHMLGQTLVLVNN